MQVSRRDALRYAAAVSALAGLGAAAGLGAPAASAAAPTLIDFAARQIPARDIRAAGHAGVINYVSTSRPGSTFGAKPITLPYARELNAAGLAIVSNFQYGKPGGTAPSDFTRGYAGGVADARTAWATAHRCRWRQERTDLLQRRRRHRPQHVEFRRAAVVSGNQLRDRGAADRHLRGHQAVPVGHCRWCASGGRARPAARGHGRPDPGRAVRSTRPQ